MSKIVSKNQKFIFFDNANKTTYTTVKRIGNNFTVVVRASPGVFWQNQNITTVCIKKKTKNAIKINILFFIFKDPYFFIFCNIVAIK